MNLLKKINVINFLLNQFGFNVRGIYSLFKIPRFIFNLIIFLYKGGSVSYLFPMLLDNHDAAGSVNGHYFTMDIVVSKYLYKAKPNQHLDIGSRVDGFISNIAVFLNRIDILDIRDLTIKNFSNINFIKGDLIKFTTEKKYSSISSLHTIEHIGLGRYGDEINPNGHILAISKIISLLADDGILYLAFPVGVESVVFNAHRVFDYDKSVNLLNNLGLNIIKFDYITTDGLLIPNADGQHTKNESYGCGIYTCIKK